MQPRVGSFLHSRDHLSLSGRPRDPEAARIRLARLRLGRGLVRHAWSAPGWFMECRPASEGAPSLLRALTPPLTHRLRPRINVCGELGRVRRPCFGGQGSRCREAAEPACHGAGSRDGPRRKRQLVLSRLVYAMPSLHPAWNRRGCSRRAQGRWQCVLPLLQCDFALRFRLLTSATANTTRRYGRRGNNGLVRVSGADSSR